MVRAPHAAQRTRVRAPRGPSTGSAVRCWSGVQTLALAGPGSAEQRFRLHRIRDT